MKNTRKFLAIFMVIAMIMSMGVLGIFADENTEHTITIDNENTGYEYTAYQIFSGNLVNGQLQGLDWGAGIDSGRTNELIAALNEIEAFADCKNVVDVATVLGKITTSNHATTMAFADVVSKYLSTSEAGLAGADEYDYDEKNYVMDVTGDGYYLVMNTSVPTDGTDTTYTRYILRVFGDTTITHKGEFPTVEKKIVEEYENEVDANTSEIGKTITYKFTGTIPGNIADYDTYYYVFTDTMSKGLTYAENLKVTVNNVNVTDYFYANTAEGTDDNGEATTVLTVGMSDLLALEKITTDIDLETDGTQIVGEITDATEVVVTYDAIVNEKAVIGVNGNTNDVELKYSNDPNNDGEGATTPPDPNPEEPQPETPTGDTPKDTVITFLTEIKLIKVDALTQERLVGAKFSISGLSSKVKVINKEMYVPYAEDEEIFGDVWYRLKDGTYTMTAPVYEDDEITTDKNEKTSDSYDIEENETEAKKYKLVEQLDYVNVEENFTAEGWVIAEDDPSTEDVNEEGTITFTGLGEGTYTITEMLAPNGYNVLEEPIEVVISAKVGDSNVLEAMDPSANTTVTWSATVDGKVHAVEKDGTIEIEVGNTSGSTLPSTGSIGTTIFYVAGGIMVVAAVIFLVTKKRMKNAEN